MKVPVYERQVSDAGPARFRQNLIDGSGAQYNALRAEQGGEAVLIHGVDRFNAALGRLSEDFDEARTAEAVAEAYKQKQQLIYADGGLIHAKGSDAAGMADRINEGCKKINEEIGKKLQNGRQRQAFAKSVASSDLSFSGTGFRTESAQLEEYRSQKAKELLGTFSSMYASGMSMETQEDTLTQALKTAGAADTPENRTKFRRLGVSGGLDMMAANDPIAALEQFKKDASIFPEGDREVIRQKLEKAAKPVKAQDLSASLYESTGGSLEKMLTTIEKEYSGEEENYFKSAAKQYWSEQKQFAELRAGDALDKVMELMHTSSYAAAKSFVQSNKAALGDKYWQTMDSVDRFFERGKFAGSGGSGRSAKLSPAEKIELYDTAEQALASGKYDGEGGKKRFLNDFGKVLYSSDLKKLVDAHFNSDGSKSDFFSLKNAVGKIKSEYGISLNVDEDLDFSESCADALRAAKKKCIAAGVPFSNRVKLQVVRDLCSEVVVGHESAWYDWMLPGRQEKEVTALKYQRESAIRKAAQEGKRIYTDAEGNTYEIGPDNSVKGWKPDNKVKPKNGKGK